MNLSGKNALMAWKVDQGSMDGVKLDGLSVVAVVSARDTLGMAQRGPAKTLLIVDARANDAQRAAREADNAERETIARKAATHLGALLVELPGATTLDALRGLEGAAARTYFDAFNSMIRQQTEAFILDGRTRRPPRIILFITAKAAMLTMCAGARRTRRFSIPTTATSAADRPSRVIHHSAHGRAD